MEELVREIIEPMISNKAALMIKTVPSVENEATEIIDGFKKRSEEIKQEGFIEKKYQEFADSMIDHYLWAFSGIKRNFFYKVFDKLSGHRLTRWVLKRKYDGKRKLALRNYIECEAHRELVLSGLK